MLKTSRWFDVIVIARKVSVNDIIADLMQCAAHDRLNPLVEELRSFISIYAKKRGEKLGSGEPDPSWVALR